MKLTAWRLLMLVGLGLGLIFTACATPRPTKDDLILADPQGKAAAWITREGKVHYDAKPDAIVLALVKSLAADRAELAKLQKPPEAKKADKAFDKLAEDAACETDLALAANPETPDDIRIAIYRSLTKCRTAKQEAALNRMVERLPGKKPADLIEGEVVKELRPLPKPSLLKEQVP